MKAESGIQGGMCFAAGAGSEAGAESCRGFALERPAILVMGNEGRGLRPAVRRTCATVLRIDSSSSSAAPGHQPIGVDSLNVSVASGILLHQLLGAASGAD